MSKELDDLRAERDHARQQAEVWKHREERAEQRVKYQRKPKNGASTARRSMSKKGYSPDNAPCEGLFDRLKNEMFYYVSWKNCSIAEFIDAVDKYLHWYAENRIKLSGRYEPAGV